MRAFLLSVVGTLGVLGGCTEPSESSSLEQVGVVQGRIETTAKGSAWVFLYRLGEGPPGPPSVPLAVTAVSAQRMAADPRYVMADIVPNRYRLFGLIDVDANFDASIDVLSQPSAGDVVSAGVDFQSQPARGANVELSISSPISTEPPAFSFEGVADGDIALDTMNPLTLVADAVDHFNPKKVGFVFGLVDADRDARPDDVDGDGAPDLSLQLFLRWLPRPGPVSPGASVIVPLLFDPTPFLNTLQGRLGTTVVIDRLQVALVPQAQLITKGEDGVTSTQPYGAPPVGDYELVALAAAGQFWRLPNQLGLSSQRVRLHIDRASR